MKLKKEILPSISVIIPCRNEEKYISSCIKSILKTDYPKNKIEILIIDGMSTDKTLSIIKSLQNHNRKKQIKLLINKNKTTPHALNLGIKKAKFQFLSRIDAHSTINKSYFSKGIKSLQKTNADSVGGIWLISTEDSSIISKSISHSLSNKFGIGSSSYRLGKNKEKFVDTIPGFFCKKSFLKKIGSFNEGLRRGQDMEYNIRIKKAGGKILLNPKMLVFYKARTSTIKFIKHNFLNGTWAIFPFKFSTFIPVKPRHLIPLAFASTLILLLILSQLSNIFLTLLVSILSLHIILGVSFSIPISIKEGNPIYLILLPIVFLSLHLSYGLGSLYGILKYPFVK